jgi:hypothetical protein
LQQLRNLKYAALDVMSRPEIMGHICFFITFIANKRRATCGHGQGIRGKYLFTYAA